MERMLPCIIAGATTISFALVSALTSWWGGMLVNRPGRRVIVIGIIAVMVSVILMARTAMFVPHQFVPWVFVVIMAIGGAGGGLVVSPNQALMLEDINVAEGGLAGSVGQLGQRIGNAIGSAIALSIFYAIVTSSAEEVGMESAATTAYVLGQGAVVVILAFALTAAIGDLARRRTIEA